MLADITKEKKKGKKKKDIELETPTVMKALSQAFAGPVFSGRIHRANNFSKVHPPFSLFFFSSFPGMRGRVRQLGFSTNGKIFEVQRIGGARRRRPSTPHLTQGRQRPFLGGLQ